jgi:flagellar hook-basal body complex protein FliE
MSIAPIGPIGPLTPVASVAPGTGAGAVAGSADGFASQLAQGLDRLQQLQGTSDDLAVKAATGTLADPSQYMIASTEAALATELTTAVRDKAVDAFNEIMRMQG